MLTDFIFMLSNWNIGVNNYLHLLAQKTNEVAKYVLDNLFCISLLKRLPEGKL
jgi:hypothetical protein